MRPEYAALRIIQRVAGKEITLFFSSPIAWLFLATFVSVSLFIFFWGESFFARNIADVRPLFEWMPVLLIFLASALTMRLWSEERRTGTLEHVLAQAAPLWQFVLGKFLACLFLLCAALLLTLPLPVTVALMGNLDWGPVWAGYLATILLGAAYLSIGLCVSARSDSQIVSLILACLVCGLFYLLGTRVITGLVGVQMGEWLRFIATGARFDSITRGVLDLRDLYYYFSIIAVFLALNTWMLEQGRWADTGSYLHHQRWRRTTLLLSLNFLAVNLWLGQLSFLRIDVTRGNQYSISTATERYLAELKEPLLLRGYFSSKTHPLLAPLVPRLRDLMREYEIASGGRINLEFIDPSRQPELEQEANQKYGIQPNPFQVEDRYQSSIVSSYFNILVQYGDEVQVLGFEDLIEIKTRGETGLEVRLRNPEHDLTRAIKKSLRSYQTGGNLFDTVSGELLFQGFISAPERLPEKLRDFRKQIDTVVSDLQKQASGRLQLEFHEPEAEGGQVAAMIQERYGLRPMSAGLLGGETFYFYLLLSRGDQVVQIPVQDLNRDSLERNLKAGIRRFATGFTRTVGLVTPDTDPQLQAQAQAQGAASDYLSVEQFLAEELNVERLDLTSGKVPGHIDVLVFAGARDMLEREVFAIDQFLMQGGTVILSTSHFTSSLSNRDLTLLRQESGLTGWLAHHGLEIAEELVMDPRNASFPLPVSRTVGPVTIQEIRMFDYPYFVDVRDDGMSEASAITSGLPQVLMPWASPIQVRESAERTVSTLLESSPNSWLSASMDIMPRVTEDGASSSFTPQGDTGSHALAVVSRGRFQSFFADRDSPLLQEEEAEEAEPADDSAPGEPEVAGEEAEQEPELTFSGVISHSSEAARIVLFSSSDLLRDQILRLLSTARRSEYLGSLQIVANAVDWVLEDEGLSNIRARGHFNRTLPPMDTNVKLFWEIGNYVLAVLALGVLALMQRWRHRRWQGRQLQQLLIEGAQGAQGS